MKIRKITGDLCKTTRMLWEEVFSEDSDLFTEYYFENKAAENIGYVIGEEPYEAMMFRTPYNLQIGEQQRDISYIVGVATRKECRHRGYMTELLLQSFKEMYHEKQPFTFLMPANPQIYQPFDFQYIYERDLWNLKDSFKTVSWLEDLTHGSVQKEQKIEIRAAQFADKEKLNVKEYAKNSFEEKDANGYYSVKWLREQFPQFPIMKLLTEFANRQLKEHYEIFVHREEAYYERQLKELQAQNGDMYVFFQCGEVQAYFFYAKENEEIFIQEVLEKKEGVLDFLIKEEQKKPIIMARIIHLEEMLKLVRGKENKTVFLQVKDEIITENSGVYKWEISTTESRITKLEDLYKAEFSIHIQELVSLILRGVFLNEIV